MEMKGHLSNIGMGHLSVVVEGIYPPLVGTFVKERRRITSQFDIISPPVKTISINVPTSVKPITDGIQFYC